MQVSRANPRIPTGNPLSEKVATQNKTSASEIRERGLTQSCMGRLGERLLFKYSVRFYGTPQLGQMES